MIKSGLKKDLHQRPKVDELDVQTHHHQPKEFEPKISTRRDPNEKSIEGTRF